MAAAKLDSTEEIKIDDPGVAVVDRHESNHDGNNGSDISPLGRVAEEVIQDNGNGYNDNHGECITDVHCALVESRLRFKPHPTGWANTIHFIKPQQVGSRRCKKITLSATGTFSLQQRSQVRSFLHSYSI